MATERWILISDPRRMARLLRAEQAKRRFLELSLAEAQRHVVALRRLRLDISALLDGIHADDQLLRSAALKRLAGLEVAIAGRNKDIQGLQERLQFSRGRRNALEERLGRLEATLMRKKFELELQELVPEASAKAWSKPGVME